METNIFKIADKISQAMNICYFFITDQVEKGNVDIEHFLTDGMLADFITKPLQGSKLQEFKIYILGMEVLLVSICKKKVCNTQK